jgi:hypothetical protein
LPQPLELWLDIPPPRATPTAAIVELDPDDQPVSSRIIIIELG